MGKKEKVFVITYLVFMFLYLPCFFLLARSLMPILAPFHIAGMIFSIIFLFLVMRDLYKRDFSDPNAKITWTILILCFFPSALVYLFKHALKPRTTDAPRIKGVRSQGSTIET